MPAGRPTLYTPELGQRVCKLIATEPLSIKKLCEKYNDIPSHDCINRWRVEHPEFYDQYLVAKERQALAITEEIWEESNNLLPITEEINRFNARFRFQQWHLSKLAPKQFGDKKQLDQNINATISHAQELKEVE